MRSAPLDAASGAGIRAESPSARESATTPRQSQDHAWTRNLQWLNTRSAAPRLVRPTAFRRAP